MTQGPGCPDRPCLLRTAAVTDGLLESRTAVHGLRPRQSVLRKNSSGELSTAGLLTGAVVSVLRMTRTSEPTATMVSEVLAACSLKHKERRVSNFPLPGVLSGRRSPRPA